MAAAVKISDIDDAKDAAAAYTLIPRALATQGIGLVIIVEAVIGVTLATGIAITASSVVACALLLLYAFLMSVDLMRDLRHDCGCGAGGTKISWRLVARNIGVTGAVLVASLTSSAPPPIHILSSLGVLAAWLVRAQLDAALALWRSVRAHG
jgi:hypothetical protein